MLEGLDLRVKMELPHIQLQVEVPDYRQEILPFFGIAAVLFPFPPPVPLNLKNYLSRREGYLI